MNGEEILEVTETSTEAVEVTATGHAASALQAAIENGASAPESVASESVNGEQKEVDTVRIEVQETVEKDGDVETTTTNVKIDVPVDHPELPEPEDPTKMIEEAKKMVEQARELDAGAATSSKSKRKMQDLTKDDGETEDLGRPAKKGKKTVYTTEQKLKKEKVTRRALVGVGIMAAIGFVFHYTLQLS
jgi:hypothetical protein